MKRFHFSADSLLQWRTQAAEREDARLQALFAEAQRLKDSIAQLVRARTEAASALYASASLTGGDLANLEAFRRQTIAREHALATQQADCASRIEAQRKLCVEAHRQQQLLERLKERRLTEWQYEANKELEEIASESFLSKFNRERRTASHA
jgi:flagellar export protein FliJ